MASKRTELFTIMCVRTIILPAAIVALCVFVRYFFFLCDRISLVLARAVLSLWRELDLFYFFLAYRVRVFLFTPSLSHFLSSTVARPRLRRVCAREHCAQHALVRVHGVGRH